MGGVLCLLAYWSLASLDFAGGLLLPLAAALVLGALLLPQWAARIPTSGWRIAAPLLLVSVVVDFSLSLPNFLPSLVRMVLWLLLFRALAPRQRREDLQLVCYVCSAWSSPGH